MSSIEKPQAVTFSSDCSFVFAFSQLLPRIDPDAALRQVVLAFGYDARPPMTDAGIWVTINVTFLSICAIY